MTDSKKAKYYCENCGSEVPANAKFCPKCGKFFAAVRCPECGKTGTVREFKGGCPRCHYAMTEEDIYDPENKAETLDGRKHKLSGSSKRKIKKAFNEYNKKNNGSSGSVPAWLYIFSIAVIIGLFVMLIFRCN